MRVIMFGSRFVFNHFSIYPEIVRRFRPDAIVVQCGADCLAQDPLGAFNLSLVGTAPAVRAILETDRPTLFLGGGGYHSGANSAKYWTYLTSGEIRINTFNGLHFNAKSWHISKFLRVA